MQKQKTKQTKNDLKNKTKKKKRGFNISHFTLFD